MDEETVDALIGLVGSLVYAVEELERRVALLENPPQSDPLEEGAAVMRHRTLTKRNALRRA
jgi:hypothetical protein